MYRIRKQIKPNTDNLVRVRIPRLLILVLIGCLICSCGAAGSDETTPGEGSTTNEQVQDEGEGQVSVEQDAGDETRADAEPEPVDFPADWASSAHADTFVTDENEHNNRCARCHSPVNWLPSMEDIPESCLSCKFELEEPPAVIAESEWEHVPCKVCHEVDNKGNVEAQYAWLEIAQLEEYEKLDTPTELCLKCHNEAELPDHPMAPLGGAHADYECTECHDAHDAIASCAAAGCHEDVVEPATSIPGHDPDHQTVSCAACHDADGMDVGPDEETGIWVTFAVVTSSEGQTSLVPFTSHNTVLEAACDRCHYAGNPWGLAEATSPAP